ncbi:MAG: HNH endonuclease signature motif containing protein [Candidatus Sericytochromatia bacterium]
MRRAPEDDDERFQWAIDGHENVVAEVSAALRMSRNRAVAQLDCAIALRGLPKVAEVFASGEIDFRVMSTIVARTKNIEDPEVLTKVDVAVAKWVSRWTRLSKPKLQERIDWWVAKFDAAGVRLPQKATDDRYVVFQTLKGGMTWLWAKVLPADAVVIDTRLDELAATVCANDSRTVEQRRADALAALAGGRDRLVCECGSADCPGVANAKPLSDIVIHVLAEQSTVDGTGGSPGFMAGHGVLPPESVRDLAARAKLKPLVRPKREPEPRYRPSPALAEFVRWRDMTCRFPGCEKPAEVCDLDHTVPHPLGATHPSNLKLLCRAHSVHKRLRRAKWISPTPSATETRRRRGAIRRARP